MGSDRGSSTGETYDLSPDLFTLGIPRTKIHEVRTETEKIELWMSPDDAEDFAEFVGRQVGTAIQCVECGKDLADPKNCGDPDVEGDWVCADPVCRAMHDPEMEVERSISRGDAA